MLSIKTKVDNLKGLENTIEIIKKLQGYKDNIDFQKYIQQKCLKVIEEQMDKLMIYTGELVDEYKSNNKIAEFDEGFIIYNDTSVETDAEGYGGSFSIALAFEYGTGIVGEQNPKKNAWGYNLNGRQTGWWYPTTENDPNPYKWIDKDGNLHAWTRGLMGMEIYRYSCEEIQKNILNWINDYIKESRGVSQ